MLRVMGTSCGGLSAEFSFFTLPIWHGGLRREDKESASGDKTRPPATHPGKPTQTPS
jgi:hypothetical protein